MTLLEKKHLAKRMVATRARDAAIVEAVEMSRGWLVNLIAREGWQRARARNPPKGIVASAEKQEELLRLVLAAPARNRAELGRTVGISRADVKLILAAARRRGIEIPARPAGRPPGVREVRARRGRIAALGGVKP